MTKWLRYKAFLNATGAESPKLRSVTVGAVTDANYENPKPQAPRLFQRTPARSLDPKVPVSFKSLTTRPSTGAPSLSPWTARTSPLK